MSAALLLAAIVHCYVGCNSGSPDRQALHVLACETETGAAEIVQSVKGLEGTTYFQFDRDGKYLYSVIGERRNGKPVGSVVRFAMDGWRIGAMERLCELPCEAPCHVALSPDGRRVAFAAYGSATCGTVGTDGTGLATYVFPDDAMGCRADRQRKAYAHQAFFTRPDGIGPKMLGVVDLGCDRIRFFEPETMKPLPRYAIRFDSGDGPRHALIPPGSGNRLLYVLNELGNSVTALAFDGERFAKIGKWSTLPALTSGEAEALPRLKGEAGFSKAAAIKLTADGKILMASNRGCDSIAFFEIGDGGRLKPKNVAKLAGRFPRDFELMPGEKFMVVGHKMSNEIRVYRFDRAACTLTPVGAPIPAWRPLCFTFGK